MSSNDRDIAGVFGLAGEIFGKVISEWYGSDVSPDQTIRFLKQISDSRATELYWTNPIVSTALTLIEDSVVGDTYTLNTEPLLEELGLSEQWGADFEGEVEEKFAAWSTDEGNFVSSDRKMGLVGLLKVALRSFLTHGEVLGQFSLRETDGFGTNFHIIDPQRLSDPVGQNDKKDDVVVIKGVETDKRTGEITAVYINDSPDKTDRDYHPKRCEVKTRWGRDLMFYLADWGQPDQTRGVSQFHQILELLKILEVYRLTCIVRATASASLFATITSDVPAGVSLGGLKAYRDYMEAYEQAVSVMEEGLLDAHGNPLIVGGRRVGAQGKLKLFGAQVSRLTPNEKLNIMSPVKDGSLGTEFEISMLRTIASHLGVSYEDLTGDFTRTNYSSSKAAAARNWKRALNRRAQIVNPLANAIFRGWFEEGVVKDKFKALLHKGAPSFWQPGRAKQYTNCSWIGAGRAVSDELKQAQADTINLSQRLTTLQQVCAERGLDWRKVLKQQAKEKSYRKKLGLGDIMSDSLKQQINALGVGDKNKDEDDGKTEQSGD